MKLMSVTLEVSQPEMSALKFFKLEKRLLMSVMAETHQSAMGPHVAVAAVGLALNSLTAVCREALVVKMQGGEGDGGGGDGELASQQVFLHFLRCLAFVHLLTFLHVFLFALSVRPLQSFGREGGGGEGDGGGGDGETHALHSRTSWTSWASELISVC